jgi:hypothetical protein
MENAQQEVSQPWEVEQMNHAHHALQDIFVSKVALSHLVMDTVQWAHSHTQAAVSTTAVHRAIITHILRFKEHLNASRAMCQLASFQTRGHLFASAWNMIPFCLRL